MSVNAIRGAHLAGQARLRHGFFTRTGGVSDGLFDSLNCGLGSGDDIAAVQENRARAMAHFGLAACDLITCYQVHSAKVVTTAARWTPDVAPRADAMVTRQPGIALGILTADCAPLLFADADAGVIGAAHAGWRGAFSGIGEAAIDAMRALGARPDCIDATIGPCIGPQCYEVGPEFRTAFLAQDPELGRFFRSGARPGRHMFDLPAYLHHRLAALGLRTIDRLDLDTYGEPERFFSYRRATHRGEADYGRLLSAIALIG